MKGVLMRGDLRDYAAALMSLADAADDVAGYGVEMGFRFNPVSDWGDAAPAAAALAAKPVADSPKAAAVAKAPLATGVVTPAPGTSGGPWTDAEDDMIVAACVAHPDDSALAMGKRMSLFMPRTYQAIAYRVSNPLRQRIADARAAKLAPEPQPVEIAPASQAPAANVTTCLITSDLPAWQKQLRAALNALGYREPWTAALDLEIVKQLARGTKLDMLAADLGLDTDAVKARFAALTAPLRDERNKLGMDAQQRLLTELRARVALLGMPS